MWKVIGLSCGICMLAAGSAAGQEGAARWEIQIRGGVAVPTAEFDRGNHTGNLIGFAVKHLVSRPISIYGGYERTQFDSIDPDSANADASTDDDGWRLGLQVDIPVIRNTWLTPYVQLGGIYNRAKLSLDYVELGSLTFTSERSFGYEVGAGAGVALTRNLSIIPEVRYRNYQPEFEMSTGQHLTYSSVSIGLGYRM